MNLSAALVKTVGDDLYNTYGFYTQTCIKTLEFLHKKPDSILFKILEAKIKIASKHVDSCKQLSTIQIDTINSIERLSIEHKEEIDMSSLAKELADFVIHTTKKNDELKGIITDINLAIDKSKNQKLISDDIDLSSGIQWFDTFESESRTIKHSYLEFLQEIERCV